MNGDQKTAVGNITERVDFRILGIDLPKGDKNSPFIDLTVGPCRMMTVGLTHNF
jgi:hypothetical protein